MYFYAFIVIKNTTEQPKTTPIQFSSGKEDEEYNIISILEKRSQDALDLIRSTVKVSIQITQYFKNSVHVTVNVSFSDNEKHTIILK